MAASADGTGDEPWVRLASWQRRRRRLTVSTVPLLAVAWVGYEFLFPRRADLAAALAVWVLAGATAAGWWWLEHSARQDPDHDRLMRRQPSGPSPDWVEDLAEARAEYLLRHRLPVPDGARYRVGALARERVREARSGSVLGLVIAAVGVAMLINGGFGYREGVPAPVGGLCLVVGVAVVVRSVWRGMAGRRWQRNPSLTPPEVP